MPATASTSTLYPFCTVQIVDVALPSKRTIDSTTGVAAEGGTVRTFSSDDLDIRVETDFDVGESAQNTATITLYNLSEASRAFITRGKEVNVTLGYKDGEVSAIFTGLVLLAYTDREGVDFATTLYCIDAVMFKLQSTTVPDAFPAHEASDVAVKRLLTLARVPAGTIEIPTLDNGDVCSTGARWTPNGKTVLAALYELADLAAEQTNRNFRVIIRNGSVSFIHLTAEVTPDGEDLLLNEPAVVLNPSTGLIKADPVIGEEMFTDADLNSVLVRIQNRVSYDGQSVEDDEENQQSILDAEAAFLETRSVNFEAILTPRLSPGVVALVSSQRIQGPKPYICTRVQHFYSIEDFRTTGQLFPASSSISEVLSPT